MGCDASDKNSLVGSFISIHAPTWGATRSAAAHKAEGPISIHAPTWGATNILTDYERFIKDFNPRTHVGCDRPSPPCSRSTSISIHAPTWGATPYLSVQSFNNKHFNPRTHVGCDLLILFRLLRCHLFQSTHPRGVRLLSHQMVGF